MRIREVIERFGGVCEGDDAVEINAVTGVDLAGPGDTTFALDERSLAAAEARGASCVIVPQSLRKSPTTLLRCTAPQRYVAELLRFLHPEPTPVPGVHPSAIVGEGTSIAAGASLGPHVTVGTRCRIGTGAVLMAGVVVGDECEIGAGTVIHPNVSLYAKTHLGARVIIHAGAVIGADGFGYFPDNDKLHKWPHVGNVVLEDEVEIGANVCIDRARFGTTLIERGAKIDNLVQIAHNCRVGPGAILAGQVGLSGSVTVEAGAVCAGQVGIADHNTIGRGARVGAQSGVINDIPPGAEVLGYPAKPARQCLEEIAMLSYLNENRAALRKLIKQAGAP
jgi:UDP-3-O-[3-hydroxymyristoyl] glucosamine N-acyltransferase